MGKIAKGVKKINFTMLYDRQLLLCYYRELPLKILSVYNYAKITPSSPNMIEGQSVINSVMIIMCGISEWLLF